MRTKKRHMFRFASVALACIGLSVVGCAQLLGLKDDVPSGACTTDRDCAPSEVCGAGTCQPSGSSGNVGSGGNGSGNAGDSGNAGGSGNAAGSGGTSADAGEGGSGAVSGSGTSGSAGSGPVVTCTGTAVGDSVACNELSDGTAINFPGGAAQAPCAAGMKVCKADGKFGPCLGAVAPGPTDCTSASDTNCNGKPDNTECGLCTVGATQYCYDGPDGTKGVGKCQQGTQVCQLDASGSQTVWGACAGEITPAQSDTCDTGNDATCNNKPNEGCSCINGQQGACGAKLGSFGNCAAGTTKCASGNWGACSIVAKASDTCDPGDDATCNGHANDGCTCVNGKTQTCAVSDTGCAGSQSCAGGAWGGCGVSSCEDFNVQGPSARCSTSLPNGEPDAVTCSDQVCSAGYHVIACGVFAVSGSGTCSFQGADSNPAFGVISAKKPTAGNGVTCGYGTCSCHRDGF